MHATIAVLGPRLGWVALLERRLRELGYRVIGADGSLRPHQHLQNVIVAGDFGWSDTRHGREAAVRRLDREAATLDGLLSQDSDVIFLIRLVSVPAGGRHAALQRLEAFARQAEADITNLDGLDSSVNVLAFDDWAEVEDDLGRIASQLTEGFGGRSDVALHIDEVRHGDLQEALIGSTL